MKNCMRQSVPTDSPTAKKPLVAARRRAFYITGSPSLQAAPAMPALPRVFLVFFALLPLGYSSEVDALQDPKKSEIRGTVVRAADRQPVTGAKVSLDGTEFALVTDGKGKFKFPKVAAGQYIIRAEVEGFPVATSTVLLAQGDRLDVEFQVGTSDAVTLPELKVTEAAPVKVSPIVEFNRRATSGNGRYITRDFIEKRHPATLMDLMRALPGVRIECPRSERVCRIRMSRAPRGCGPGYFLDGIPADQSVLFLTSPTDVEGIEVYSGPSETPAELEGVRSLCGVVAIWTRIGEKPSERKPQ